MTDHASIGNLLGVDQTPPPEPEPESASLPGGTEETQAATPPAEAPTMRQIEEAEYLRLKEDADTFGVIKGDPELSQQVISMVQAKMKGVSPSIQPPLPKTPQAGVSSELEALRAEHARLSAVVQENMAREAIREFASRTQDFDQHKLEMGKILRDGRARTIEDAYALAKSHAAQQQGARTAKPPLQASETKSGGVPRTNSDAMKAVQDRINDRKATPRSDDYIDAAFKAALKAQGASASE